MTLNLTLASRVQQLCVSKYEPFEKWWRFVICQNYQGRERFGEYIGELDSALKCAITAGIDWEASDAGQVIILLNRTSCHRYHQ